MCDLISVIEFLNIFRRYCLRTWHCQLINPFWKHWSKGLFSLTFLQAWGWYKLDFKLWKCLFLNSDFAKSLLELYWVHEWRLFFEVVQKTLKAFDSPCCSLSDCVIQFLHRDAASCTPWLKLNSFLVWLMLCQGLVSLTYSAIRCFLVFVSVKSRCSKN